MQRGLPPVPPLALAHPSQPMDSQNPRAGWSDKRESDRESWTDR